MKRPPSAPAGSYPIGAVSRGGLFFCADRDVPPLFSQVLVVLPGGARPAQGPGEVVRHVSADQAKAWHMRPGFAVQLALQAMAPEDRRAFEAMSQETHAEPQPVSDERRTLDGATALLLLESLESRACAGHYELLDLPPDAGLPEGREKARGMRRQVEDLRSRLPHCKRAVSMRKPVGRSSLRKGSDQVAHLGLHLVASGQRLRDLSAEGFAESFTQPVNGNLQRALVQA